MNWGRKLTWPRILTVAMLVFTVGVVTYLCAFKLLDRDFWWHITAGKVMVETGELIKTEPFSYVRAGQPYLATHEWLAQVVLYGVYAMGGVKAIIAFRTLMMAATFGVLLLLNRRQIWVNGFVVLYAATVTQPGWLERPQLFTFLILASFLVVTFRVLDNGLSWRRAMALVGLQIVWVNTHGAASLAGVLIWGAAVIQVVFDSYQLSRRRKAPPVVWRNYLLVGVVLGAAMLISPDTYHNFTYLYNLLQDKTIFFINEWRPRPWNEYAPDLLPLWLLVGVALATGRRHVIFAGTVLVMLGYMSRQAIRHEMLFAIAAAGIIIYELAYSRRWQAWLTRLLARRQLLVSLFVVGLLLTAWHARVYYMRYAQRDHIHGYGVFTPAKGAYDFIEANNIQGAMFNTYGVGGYLMYRGYQQRPVYIDGRNVDYGYDHMYRTFLAGKQPTEWQKLEDQYHFTYAIVDYDANTDKEPPLVSYSVHLEKNPRWKLVYVDDWSAVYVKDIPENKVVIQKYNYSVLTVSALHFNRFADVTDATRRAVLIDELKRVVAADVESIKARLTLARLYLQDKRYDEARVLANEARHVRPYRSEVYEVLAAIALAQQHFPEAAQDYENMLTYAGQAYPDLNYGFLEEVFRAAGRPYRAWYYGLWVQPTPPAMATATVTPAAQDPVSEITGNMEEDIRRYNNEGILYAEKGEFSLAEAAFLNALKLDPSNPTTLTNIGALRQQQGNITEAIDYYRRALERDKDYADAHYNLATALYIQRDYQGAQREAQRAAALGRDATELLQRIRAQQ